MPQFAKHPTSFASPYFLSAQWTICLSGYGGIAFLPPRSSAKALSSSALRDRMPTGRGLEIRVPLLFTCPAPFSFHCVKALKELWKTLLRLLLRSACQRRLENESVRCGFLPYRVCASYVEPTHTFSDASKNTKLQCTVFVIQIP